MTRLTGNGISYSNYVFLDWGLNWQDEENNYSQISWATYWHFQSSDRQLDNGTTNINGGGAWRNGGRIYNFASNYSTRDMLLANGNYNIGHNAGGDKVFNIYISVLGYNGEWSSASGDYGLPTLYRYAQATYVEANNVTDVSFNWRTDINRLGDAIAISLDGGGWNYFYGDYYSRTDQLGSPSAPLLSGHTYSVRISTRRKASGFWAEAGNWNVTTNTQNNFFDMTDF